MRTELLTLAWPVERLGEGLEALLAASGMAGRCRKSVGSVGDDDSVVADRLAEAMPAGLEVDSVEVRYDELEDVLVHGCPLIVRATRGDDSGFILFLKSRGQTCRLITPDHRVRRVKVFEMKRLLCVDCEASITEVASDLLPALRLSKRRLFRAEQAFLSAALMDQKMGGIWIVRPEPGASFLDQLHRQKVPARLAAVTFAHVSQYVLLIASWWLIGRGVLGGHFDRGWLWAWVLTLFSLVIMRVSIVWIQGKLAIDLSESLKIRLLHGMIRLDLSWTRHLGAGKFLSWAIESAAVQDLVLDGTFLAFLAGIEMVLTLGILAIGAGGAAHVAAFVLWFAVVFALAFALHRAKDLQTEERLRLTHDLTEQMIGHRTRLAQQSSGMWHEGEDEALDAYLGAMQSQDRRTSWMQVVGIGWQIVAVVTLLPTIVMGQASEATIAVAVGGIILGERALVAFGGGIARLSDALIAWKRVRPVFDAGALKRSAKRTSTAVECAGLGQQDSASDSPAILARNLSYKGPGRMHPVLDRIDLQVFPGDRVLLEGPSGSGKSTLAALLAGLRFPDAGALLVNGADFASRGEKAWSRQVAVTPQFGENHLFSETLAFNLLMGRDWPPTDADLAEAECICSELGLGDLLRTMPAGIHQMVGDTGWHLSHGERSRVFVARALLQGPKIVILDESLGPLDAENRASVMECVERHVGTLIVIAHP